MSLDQCVKYLNTEEFVRCQDPVRDLTYMLHFDDLRTNRQKRWTLMAVPIPNQRVCF